jgi:hypothetical protein
VADANDTGRTLLARSESERALLGQIAALPSGTPQKVSGLTVVAEPSYAAASGHTCRALHFTPAGSQQTQHRVACSDGRAWFFVPDVFGAASDGAAE